MTSKYLKHKIYYTKEGISNKQTIVLIHGVSSSSSAWKHYLDTFKEKYKIISIDLRGHGKSFRPKKFSDYSLKKFSQDIYDILRKEKEFNVIIISHSFGNFVTFEFMKKYNDLVKGLILISPSTTPKKCSKLLWIFPLFAKIINYFPQIKKKGKQIDYDKYLGSGDFNLKRLFADISNTGLRSYLFSISQIYNYSAESLIKKIIKPTLIIHGDKDSFFPIKFGEEIHKNIKNSEFVPIKNANHILLPNNFDEVSKAIDNFLTKIIKK